MPQVRCPRCSALLKAGPSAAGKLGQCPKCGERVRFPAEEAAEEPDDFRGFDESDAGDRDFADAALPEQTAGTKPATTAIPWSLKALCLLPWGIAVMACGGLVPCLVAGGLSAACFGIARRSWPAAVRVMSILAVVGVGYVGFVGAVIGIAVARNGGWNRNPPAVPVIVPAAPAAVPVAPPVGPVDGAAPAGQPARTLRAVVTDARVSIPFVAFVRKGATIRLTRDDVTWVIADGAKPPRNVIAAFHVWNVATEPVLTDPGWLPDDADLAAATIEHRGGQGQVEIVEATADDVTVRVTTPGSDHAFLSFSLALPRTP